MTALSRYQKLECLGLWRDQPEAQRREVAVAFGESTLVLSDPRSGVALTHWSLPAVVRLNPGAAPALFAPAPEGHETLELDDSIMIEAIETVREAIAQARPHPGRLRGSLLTVGGLVALALAVFWLPGAMIAHTAGVVPASKRVDIGQAALADVVRVAGTPCAAPLGQRALERLSDRVFGPGGAQLFIVPDGVATAVALPGRIILLSSQLVEAHDGPEVAAGMALAEMARAEAADPLVPLLRHAGLAATFRLLTTGNLADRALSGYAERLLIATPQALDEADLLMRFEQAGLASSPYAYTLDPTGESVLGLIEADPFRATAPRPVLPDGDWVSLQAICLPE